MPLQPPAEAARATRAAFPVPGDPARRAHPKPAVQADRVGWAAAAAPELVVPEPVVPAAGSPLAVVRVAVAPVAPSWARPDRAAPAGAVDSRGVPGRSCLWIPKYWEYVSNVFSCHLQHLHCDIGIPYFCRVLQMLCTSSHTVLYPGRQNMSDGILARNGCKPVFISWPLPSVLRSRVWWNRLRDRFFSRRTPQPQNLSFTNYEGEYTWQ